MRGKWVLISISAILLAVAAGALSRLRSQRNPAAASQPAVARPASPGEISLAGTIEAQQVTVVGAQVSGSVSEFFADVGREVSEGELLARLSNQGLQTASESAQAAMDQAQARVEKAGAAIISARLEATRARADAIRARSEYDRSQRTYQRQKTLNAEGATPRLAYEKSQRDFESAQGEYQSLEDLARVAENRVSELVKEQENAKRILQDKAAELEAATTDLAGAEVHSPVDGLVVGRKGEVGRELSAQEQAELFQIAVNLSALQVRVNPDPVALKQIKPGAAALVVIADLAGEGLPGTVKELQGNQAIIAFTSPNPVVKPGMTAQVKLKY
jgi:multidrug resistance efflux pump